MYFFCPFLTPPSASQSITLAPCCFLPLPGLGQTDVLFRAQEKYPPFLLLSGFRRSDTDTAWPSAVQNCNYKGSAEPDYYLMLIF